jgi:50S ribosomal protein L16 3-hydroxylase
MNQNDNQRIRLPDGIDAESFLRDYWQQKPLLMRGALSPTRFSLSPDELAGLATEPDIESRLLVGGNGTDISKGWRIEHGPFDEASFAALPRSHWTLLVQDVDKYLPEVAALIELFDFVPQWRIDDVMISFATDGGGVGPHTDAYDVFLMQASGRRRWRLSYRDYADDDLLPGLEQRILAHFDTDEDWLLEPGDLLYLPPGVAHWGTADGDCMTYSLGFRAPSQAELAGDWFQHAIANASDDRLQDGRGIETTGLGEIGAGTRAAARRLVDRLVAGDTDAFDRWLGCHLTEPKPQFDIVPADVDWNATDLLDHLDNGGSLVRNPAARMAWSALSSGELLLFCQGEARELPGSLQALAEALCRKRRFEAAECKQAMSDAAAARELLLALVNDGVLEPDVP